VASDHAEGGMYIGPEFQLGQVYDGGQDTGDTIVLYRPVYPTIRLSNTKSTRDPSTAPVGDSKPSESGNANNNSGTTAGAGNSKAVPGTSKSNPIPGTSTSGPRLRKESTSRGNSLDQSEESSIKDVNQEKETKKQTLPVPGKPVKVSVESNK
ncbi:unnamed protein product, partial [Allacma fusca]